MVIKEATAVETMDSTSTTNAPKPSSNKTVIIAQEIKFARALAGNCPKLRRKVLRNLKTWLTTRSQSTFAFSDADFLRLWKGLFYCMWMSDKPLVQEELAESVGSLARCFEQNVPVAIQFFKAFMQTMGLEWFGIDRWRMDKFMMFVRRVTRQTLFVLHENKWQKEHVALFLDAIEATVLDQESCPFGLTNHFNDLLLEEIAKVSNGKVSKKVVTQIVEPYVRHVLKNDDPTVIKGVLRTIFHALMQQSDLGQMYNEKFDLWKKTNFVTGNIDDVEFDVRYKYDDEEDEDGDEDDTIEGEEEEGQEDGNGEVENDESEDEEQEHDDQTDEDQDDENDEESDEDDEGTEKVYDPRAGRVSVEIPQIQFDPLEIISLFEKHRYKPYSTSYGKKTAATIVNQLTRFASGMYPLGIQRVPSTNPKDYEVDIDEQVEDIEKFHKDLFGEKRKSWKELKREKQQQRILLRQRKEAKMAEQTTAVVPAQETSTEPETTVDENTEANDIAPSDTTDQDGSETLGPVAKKTKKKKKLRNKNPAVMKKQLKLEMLKRKKQAKLLLLKERLKGLKTTEPTTNGSDISASSQQPSTSPASAASSDATISVKQSKQSVVKKLSTESSAKKQQPSKDKVVSKKNGKPFQMVDEWSAPLKEGEEEYFIPSRKLQAKGLSTPNPVKISAAKPSLKRTPPSPIGTSSDTDPSTPARKRVKIALNKNVAQDLVEHIKQVKSSPQLPFDSSRKPSKSLLKPNLIPSPINPFYKKKIGLK